MQNSCEPLAANSWEHGTCTGKGPEHGTSSIRPDSSSLGQHCLGRSQGRRLPVARSSLHGTAHLTLTSVRGDSWAVRVILESATFVWAVGRGTTGDTAVLGFSSVKSSRAASPFARGYVRWLRTPLGEKLRGEGVCTTGRKTCVQEGLPQETRPLRIFGIWLPSCNGVRCGMGESSVSGKRPTTQSLGINCKNLSGGAAQGSPPALHLRGVSNPVATFSGWVLRGQVQ